MGWLISLGLLGAAIIFGFRGEYEIMHSLLIASGLFGIAGAITSVTVNVE